jgi:hypothetical protein
MGLLSSKRTINKKITEDCHGGDDKASNPAKWTDADVRKLDALKFLRIAMADAAIARYEEQQKRDAVLAIKKMAAEERAEFLQQVAEMDATDLTDEQSDPPSPTPV